MDIIFGRMLNRRETDTLTCIEWDNPSSTHAVNAAGITGSSGSSRSSRSFSCRTAVVAVMTLSVDTSRSIAIPVLDTPPSILSTLGFWGTVDVVMGSLSGEEVRADSSVHVQHSVLSTRTQTSCTRIWLHTGSLWTHAV